MASEESACTTVAVTCPHESYVRSRVHGDVRVVSEGVGAAAPSQTLDRGLRILEILARTSASKSIADIAVDLEVHRSITYRLLRTLEAHALVERDRAGRYRLGLGLPVLARSVRYELQAVAQPRLVELADELGMTAFLVVRSGDDAVTLASMEPQDAVTHVAYRLGTRHPVGQGAPGLALLMPEEPDTHDREALREARRNGWASSQDEITPGLKSVAAPVLGRDGRARAAVAVVFVDDSLELAPLGRAVARVAEQMTAALASFG